METTARSTLRTLTWCGPIVVSLVACEPEARPAPATVRDSAGVQIIEHGPEPAGLASWTLAETPEAVIGSLAEEDPAHQFTEIRGAVRLSDGRIVVGDWGSKEARYFSPSGAHLYTVGGAGEGPGEIRFLYNVDRVRGDTMVIGGWPIGSRYWFDENGDFIRNEALGPWFPGMLGRTLPDGSLILDTFEFGSYGNTLETWAVNGPHEDIRPAGVLERVSAGGIRVDTLGTILGEWYHKTGQIRVDFAMHALPYTPIGLAAWSTEHVFVGHTERPEVRVHSATGSLVRIVRWAAAAAVPVRGPDRAAFERELFSNLRRPAREPLLRRWLLEVSYPETMPAFAAMISDEDGFLWVRSSAPTDAQIATWTVYDPDGFATAEVPVPAHFELIEVDRTHVLATYKDDFDVAFVSSYAIVR